MKIRRLEIQGFKSFADRTVLKFGDGITGVVGPNGCGKSNIVDAIRWVMGEQSAKHLRGLGMQDVIFAGCEARGPAGMAEVTIAFKNDGLLVPPEYSRYEEIGVTRRLYRDGTSEYAINGVGCRLRDILDLFMGTGIGKNAYAIIEQGRIGLIVTARPEERRALIEDAAGVSRYKARRKQAERRIAATEQNLLRVRDLVSELSARRATLEKQAERSERYKAMRAELKGLDLHAAAHRYLELEALLRFERSRHDELFSAVEAERAAVEEEEAALIDERASLAAKDEAVRAEESSLNELSRALDRARQSAEFLVREDAKLEERMVEASAERAALLEEQASARTERAELEAAVSSLVEDAGEEGRQLEVREIALDALGERITEARAGLEREKQSLVEGLTALARRRSAIESLARRADDLEGRAAAARQDGGSARTRAEETRKRVGKLERDLSERRQMKLALEEELGHEERRLGELRTHGEEVEAEIGRHRERLSDRRSRLRSLEQIRANYEGCSDAVRAVMQHEQPGLRGLVADVLAADPKFETAVEAVLGERLMSVVVTEQQDGFDAVRFLRDGGHGRSTFVPLDLRLDHAPWAPRLEARDAVSTAPPRGVPKEIPTEVGGELSASEFPLPVPAMATERPALSAIDAPMPRWIEEEDGDWPDLDDPRVCGKMVDLVRARPGFEPVAEALLGDVVVVEDLEKAHALWLHNGHRKTLVTLAGEVLDPMGLFTGGSSAGVSAGLLAQKREIEALQTEVRGLEARIAEAEAKKRDVRAQIERLAARVKSMSAEGQAGALSIVSFERDIAGLRDRAQQEVSSAERSEADAERLAADLEALRAEATATEEAIRSIELAHADAEHRVADAADALEALEQQARELSEAITHLKVGVAARKERQDGSRRGLARVTSRLEEIDRRLERLLSVLDKSEAERTSLAERLTSERAAIGQLEVEVAEATARVEAQRADLERDKGGLGGRESDARTRRDALERVKARLNKAELKRRELELGCESLEAQVRERHRLELTEILVDHHLSPPPTDAERRRAKKLEKQLAEFGAINLTALEEFEVVRARHDHLSSQKQDLEQALDALRAAIRKINTTSRDRYVEAFRLVNEKFQQVFPKLFSGGRCALVMMDEKNPLESGIEIMAQPPGKKLQSVNLLSGGEKALTAVSLIFGIFLIKPTPFCLLDEVDAPLDEANVGRYNEMLREMSPISQFVLITHNKRTMELPDRLYGVTMETPGISKIVPVDVAASERTELRAV